MSVKGLMYEFVMIKKQSALNLNELLDFAQKCYLTGEINIVEYKSLFCKLNNQGAVKPEDFIINNRELVTDVS